MDPYYGGFDPFYQGSFAGYTNYDSFQPPMPPISIVVPVLQLEMTPPVPPPPIRLEIHEYQWPASNANSAAVFSIVSRDQRVEFATAIWRQGNLIFYRTPDGRQRHIPLESVDLERTRQQNAGKQLNTPWLPDETN